MLFQFKKFSIKQNKSAMKIGTDAVLLGAWTPIPENIFSVLDIGAGTGILALMLAQRTNAEQIDAIEIDEDAYEECVENFENSPWSDKLFCYHAGLDEFLEEMQDESFDLIISNPPFFTDNYKSENKSRDLARFEDALPFDELIESAANLLSEFGIFSVIIPFKEEEKFIALAKEFQLFPFKTTHVKGTPTSKIKRSLIAFKWDEQTNIEDELVIEIERHQYTPEYIELTKEFYLKM
uniref:tRNA1(Val) (adenine(37)-N6)-methyltransferase n=1 Tax=Flavobacterium sp. TaxID=239 RepID=UPI004049C897